MSDQKISPEERSEAIRACSGVAHLATDLGLPEAADALTDTALYLIANADEG